MRVPRRHTVGMRLALAIAAAAALGAGSPAAAVGGSGLRGTVMRGPVVPVCRVGQSCDAPAARVVLVFRRAGREARTTTGADGRYRIALAPGTWTVSLTRTGLGSRISPREVVVVRGRFRVVDLAIDTGIR